MKRNKAEMRMAYQNESTDPNAVLNWSFLQTGLCGEFDHSKVTLWKGNAV